VFEQPNVDNGIVYVGTSDSTLMGFGALASKTPALIGANLNFPAKSISQTVTETATFTAAEPTTLSSFAWYSSSFSIGAPSETLPASLSTGQSITVPVTFTPILLGTNSGTLTANVTGGTTTINLTGQGETPTTSFTTSPDEANFSPDLIGGHPSAPIPITFTNISSAAINVTGFAPPILPFTVTNAPTNQTIQPNGKLTFDVVFHPPSSSGDFVHVFIGVATLNTSAGDFGVALSGSADPPATLSTAPDVLNFGRVAIGSSETLRFDLGDQGGFPLRILRSTPPKRNGFSALTNPFVQLVNAKPPDTIASNTSVQETARFAPTKSGYVTTTWLLEGNDGNGVQRVTLNGTGYKP
jgi:hypothetical protein